MLSKREKQVNFAPIVNTNEFVRNVYNNVKKYTAEDINRAEAATQINKAFTTYLAQLDEDFPTIVYDENDAKKVKELDARIIAYYVLMSNLAKNIANLPVSYQGHALEFHVSGWPVAPDNKSFAQWGAFTREAAAAFCKAFPDANLTAWAVPMPNELVEVDSQDEQESTPTIALPPKELELEQDSINMDSASTHLETTPGLQLNQEEMENYDFDTWQAPKKLTNLLISIKAMHAYGLGLKSACPEKAKAAMHLAIELANDLESYYTFSSEENKDVFAAQFHKKLHSQDALMSTHRHYSKVILANIIIALTGLGLLAVGASLLFRGHGFFNTPQGQNKVNDINQEFFHALKVM